MIKILLEKLLVLLTMLSVMIAPKLGGSVQVPASVPSDSITIEGKDYTPQQYADLKTSLSGKIDAKIPLKVDSDNNEIVQFYAAVNIERAKCKGAVGRVNGSVVDAMNNLLKNGCPK